MGYFSRHYDRLKFPLAEDGKVGFRPAQIAAAYAVATHFFGSQLTAIVTMPTGAGKTAVLMACAFLLRPERLLIVTPSRLVREQIAENFELLRDLKMIEALPTDLVAPKVVSVSHRVASAHEWERLRQYDVVVATVPGISSNDGEVGPPSDLFDLVLVDEGHHAPAATWTALLEHLSRARQVLFTATPFRLDDKEIKGRFVFNYDLRRAHLDHVFGDIAFEAVVPTAGATIDTAIAQATEARFNADRQAGLQHLVMVRADTIRRAKDLKELYDKSTGLRLAFVSGQHGLAHVKAIITKLRRNELDGIVCVNMFGEGFNLPALKIAAVHSPHKSLAVTLQFIGRFARTNDKNIGRATFLAEPRTSGEELRELYETGAVWREIVQNLSSARIESEIRRRSVLDSFLTDATPDMDDFSLYTVRPYFHVKVFSVPDELDLAQEPDFPQKLQVIFRGVSGPEGAAVYLTRETTRSLWSTDDRFTNVAFDLFILHYNKQAGLLFLCASRRDTALYDRLAKAYVNGRPRMLAHSVISRALNDLEAAEFFNVGMRKRHRLGRTESYRMIAGPGADKAIQDADARAFGRGHCFGKGVEDGKEVTIGVSSASKVWSNTYAQIPELLAWCDRIATKVASGQSSATGSRLDLLSAGEELTEVPAGIIAASWSLTAYRDAPIVFYHRVDGTLGEAQLLDFDFEIVDSRLGSVEFAVRNAEITWRGVYSLGNGELFRQASDGEPVIAVHSGNEDATMSEYLNAEMPTFYCSDFSSIEGVSILPPPQGFDPFGDDCFDPIDWIAAQVEITKELPDGNAPRSIFEWLEARLLASKATVVFCDHGSGEIADFIAIESIVSGPMVSLYHCKGSNAPRPGNRVADLYEVCGQAVKSSIWAKPDDLLKRLRHRATLSSVRGYIKGDAMESGRLLGLQSRQQVQFSIYVVQPGVTMEDRDVSLSHLLGATNYYLIQGGIESFRVIGSLCQ